MQEHLSNTGVGTRCNTSVLKLLYTHTRDAYFGFYNGSTVNLHILLVKRLGCKSI